MTKIRIAALAACLSTAAFTVGCGGQAAHTVDTGSSETITTVNQIDDQDWAAAANKLTRSMLSQDGLLAPNADGSKKVFGISRTINNTAQNVDPDLLLKPIRDQLTATGKATVTTINGLNTEDPLAKRDVAQRDFASGDGTPVMRLPDYSVTTKIIETRASAGDVRQATFHFQMSLTDTHNGTTVWEGDVPITKIGAHNSVGM